MQQELADLKKRSAGEMEALRQENSRLRRKIEADSTQKRRGKESPEALRSLTKRGIEANPEKCNAIIEMRSPTNVKEVQCLIGRLTVISRFLPKLAE